MTTLSWKIIFIMTAFVSVANAQNKVVVIPLGGQELTTEQENILDFFSYDAVNDRLTISGTAENPLEEVFFQSVNVRGASQVRQDFRVNATNIPSNGVLTEIEEEDITHGSPPNNSQATVVHAFATIDTVGGVTCPCEFSSVIIQNPGPDEIVSPPSFLEVEGGDNDIDATISHTFAFIALTQSENYSFQVRIFSQQGIPADGLYEVDEAGITLTTFGLAGVGTLFTEPLGGPSNGVTDIDLRPEGAGPK